MSAHREAIDKQSDSSSRAPNEENVNTSLASIHPPHCRPPWSQNPHQHRPAGLLTHSIKSLSYHQQSLRGPGESDSTETMFHYQRRVPSLHVIQTTFLHIHFHVDQIYKCERWMRPSAAIRRLSVTGCLAVVQLSINHEPVHISVFHTYVRPSQATCPQGQ